ncbi:MAG: DUF4199 domain-containing protein [Bacteroidales bacterium]|nr:DUF4199 domain-containing protein [Bacteroidales bacterium]
MNQTEPQLPPRSSLARAANNGLFLAAYFTVLVVASGLSMYGLSAAAILVWASVLYMPFFAYRLMRTGLAECHFELSFLELMVEGMASFFLGGLMPTLITYLALRYLCPDLIANTYDQTISLLREAGTPDTDHLADTFDYIRKTYGIPTPVKVAAQTLWMILMGGTILSLLETIWLKIRFASPASRERYYSSHPQN